ncbi:Actin-Like Protein 6B [Manis pentadactyla]|nr:Actin-Like Protein 6B [Manis pentadactyla]
MNSNLFSPENCSFLHGHIWGLRTAPWGTRGRRQKVPMPMTSQYGRKTEVKLLIRKLLELEDTQEYKRYSELKRIQKSIRLFFATYCSL